MYVPQELKIKYLERRLEDVKNIRRTLAQGQYEATSMIGHQIKGSAKTFDVPQIASIAEEMENAAQVKDIKKILHLAEKMEHLLYQARGSFDV